MNNAILAIIDYSKAYRYRDPLQILRLTKRHHEY